MRRPGLFLDRDGTLIEEVNYLTDFSQVLLLDGVVEALRLARSAGLACVVITNQSAIARGYLSEKKLKQIHEFISSLLHRNGAGLDAIYYCPHHLDGTVEPYITSCSCRKPLPGMILQAAEDLDLDLSASLMVGDRLLDVEAGRRAGCKAALVTTGYGAIDALNLNRSSIQPDLVAPTLLDCVKWFLSLRDP